MACYPVCVEIQHTLYQWWTSLTHRLNQTSIRLHSERFTAQQIMTLIQLVTASESECECDTDQTSHYTTGIKATYTHTRTRLTALFPGLPRWAGTRYTKKPIWILLKQETVSGSGISWDIYKSANHSRQITTPAPHRSVYLQALPVAQPTASKHWRQKKTTWCWLSQTRGHADELATGLSLSLHRTIADSCQQNQSCSDRPLLFFANWKHFCSSQPGDTRIQTVYRQFCDVPSVCQQVHNMNTPVTVIATNQLG